MAQFCVSSININPNNDPRTIKNSFSKVGLGPPMPHNWEFETVCRYGLQVGLMKNWLSRSHPRGFTKTVAILQPISYLLEIIEIVNVKAKNCPKTLLELKKLKILVLYQI